MSSIPLPALAVKPVEQPDLLQNYGRLMALKNLQQESQQRAAMAPLQQQEAQLQVQQQQQQQRDQQAMTSAMNQWDGKSLDDLAPLVLKNGGSASAVMGLKAKSLEMKAQYSKIAADDATTGSKNIETMQKKNDMVSGAMSSVLQQPDDQLPTALTSTAQQLAQQGLLDPQHVQMAQQIAQSGNPAQIRQQLEVMRKGMLSDSQLLDEAQKTASTAASQSTTAKNQAETNYYAQHGGAPGVTVETQELNSYLKNNPGKTPQDFARWKAQQSPTAIVMGNQLGGDQNAQALDFAADNYRKTGQMPPGLARSPGSTVAIIQRAAQMDQQDGGGGIATNKAMLQANTKSLDGLQKNFDQVQAFEQTAEKNMDLLQQTAQKIPDLGARFANVPVRMISSSMIGTENMAAFKTALATAQTEAAKVLNSSNATGVLSDSSRHELQQIIDGNMPLSAMVASLNTLKQDMANRTQSYQAQIGDIQNRIRGSAGSQQAAPSNTAPKIGVGSTIVQGGHKFKVTAVDANGKPTAADPL